MTILWTSFTPWSAIIGGLLLGIAAVIMLFVNGRITGISGIFYQAFASFNQKNDWRYTFLLGLVLGAGAMSLLGFPLVQHISTSWAGIIVAGLLVGMGTKLGSGCTSGHGICGIGRMSKRSILATILCIIVAMIVVWCRHYFNLS